MLASAAMIAAVGLVACGDQLPATGSNGTSTSIKNEGLFDPCSLPDDAITAAGMDPESERYGFFGVQRTGWEICNWSGSWFYVAVLSTSHTFDEVKNDPNNIELTPVQLPGRDAVSFRHNTDHYVEACDVAFPSAEGVLTVRSKKKGSEDAREHPCSHALDSARVLEPYLPR